MTLSPPQIHPRGHLRREDSPVIPTPVIWALVISLLIFFTTFALMFWYIQRAREGRRTRNVNEHFGIEMTSVAQTRLTFSPQHHTPDPQDIPPRVSMLTDHLNIPPIDIQTSSPTK